MARRLARPVSHAPGVSPAEARRRAAELHDRLMHGPHAMERLAALILGIDATGRAGEDGEEDPYARRLRAPDHP